MYVCICVCFPDSECTSASVHILYCRVFLFGCVQYMRVDSTIDMEKVWIVLTECWRLPVPKLLISVTGGAKRFHLQPRFKNIFKQGLIHAAVSTGEY